MAALLQSMQAVTRLLPAIRNEKRIVKWMPKGTITIVLGIHPKNQDLSKNIGVKNRLKSVQGGGLFLFCDTFVPEYCIKRRF